jgi:Rrf2 family protein
MLTSTSKYALRVLVNLVGTESEDWVPGRVLSSDTGIPPNYLAKVLLALANAGLVEALRGRGGGYRLARSAGEIALIEAVEVFEGVRAHPSCLLGIHEECSDANPCSAHASFRDIRARYIAFLEGTTIADAARMESLSRPRRS